jgi:hypothetical protein
MTKTAKRNRTGMNAAAVSAFELIEAKVTGLYDEVLTVSKKNPSDSLNAFKLRVTNSVLSAANGILQEHGSAPPIEGFEQFEDAALPSNSDVVMVLSQYLECLETLRAENIMDVFGSWYWVIDGQQSQHRTRPPKKLGK